MINISPKQIEGGMKIKRSPVASSGGVYSGKLREIFSIIESIENLTGTIGILTSNKLWEVLVAAKLGHTVSSEQGGRGGAHDAVDKYGKTYEYKVSDRSYSWNFQDISNSVLKKYAENEAIILAIVDKGAMEVLEIYSANPGMVIHRLEKKLAERKKSYRNKGGLRRLQVSLSKGDLVKVRSKLVFKS